MEEVEAEQLAKGQLKADFLKLHHDSLLADIELICELVEDEGAPYPVDLPISAQIGFRASVDERECRLDLRLDLATVDSLADCLSRDASESSLFELLQLGKVAL